MSAQIAAQTNAITPGPWFEDDGEGWIIAENGKPVVQYESCGSHRAEWPNEADKVAVLAVPDLVAALRIAECGIQELCNGQNTDNECWNTLRTVQAALAKAGV